MMQPLILYSIVLMLSNLSVPAQCGEKLFSKNVEDIQIGNGVAISSGDMISVKLTSQILSDNATIHAASSDGYEVVFAGNDSRIYLNEAVLGTGQFGPMKNGGIRRINHVEQINSKQTTVRYSVEIGGILHHLPSPITP